MHAARFSVVRTGGITILAVFAFFIFFAQISSSNGLMAQATPAATGNQSAPAPAKSRAAYQAECQSSSLMDIPSAATIQAKVAGLVDSAHLKAGKEIWVTVESPLNYPGCRLESGAAIYGRILSATTQKDSGTAELSIAFNRADCDGHPNMQMPFRLVGLTAPPDRTEKMHDELPMGPININGNLRTAKKAANLGDFDLNPGGAADTVHPGVVVGMPKVKLELTGGPACSARITSTDSSVRLITGSQMILVAQAGGS